ncbi:MAG: hypothetical protein WBM78_04545, partial [Desulfobacterales bacterium]
MKRNVTWIGENSNIGDLDFYPIFIALFGSKVLGVPPKAVSGCAIASTIPYVKLNGVISIRKANFIDPSRASMYSEISNSKLQIPNKSQISISKDPNRFV